MFWILDEGGGLTATPDGTRFAGPFVVAERGDSMCVASDSLWINTGRSVVEVPLRTLRSRLKGSGAFRSSAEIVATISDRLQEWLGRNEPAAIVDYIEEHALPESCRERVLAYLKTACRNAVEAGDHGAADRAARRLWGMGDPESAAAILKPLTNDLSKLNSTSLEDALLCTMIIARQWEDLAVLIPRLWRESPIRGRSLVSAATDRIAGYLQALCHTQSGEVCERTARNYLSGQYPETPWKIEEEPFSEAIMQSIRRAASELLTKHMKEQGRAESPGKDGT